MLADYPRRMPYTYPRQPERWARYGAAFLVTVLSLTLTLVVPPLRDHAMFMLVVFAVSMSAWYGGLGPAILSIVIGGWGSTLLLPSLYSLDSPNWESLSGLVSFLVVALFISTLTATSRRAQEKIIRVLESITDGFIVFDTQWRYLYLNAQATTLVRRQSRELIGRNVWEEFPELRNSTFYVECHRAVAEDTPVNFEYFNPSFEQWLEFRAHPSAEGLTVYVTDVTVRKRAAVMILKYHEELEQRVQDRTRELEEANAALLRQVTERTHTEAALRHSEERFRSLAECANDAIVSTDSNGLILSWNRAAETIFGYPENEVIGKPFTLLMPDRYRDEHHQGIQRMQAGGGESLLAGKTIELSGLKKDGTEFALELSVAAWETGGSRFFSGIIRDISARKQAEESLSERAKELARSNSDLQRFAYAASHDMQEPLRMVASYTQLLASRYNGKLGPEADYFMNYIVDGARRMERLIHDILEYSLFDVGKKTSTSVDCEEVLAGALKNLEATIQESGATITHDTLPTIDAKPAQLSQVFQNLIGNAIKFSRGTPRIHISAELPLQSPESLNGWVFSVQDNGIGIDPDYSDQIFEVFRRLNLRHEYPGTGIGLAICKKVVEGHRGRIWVKSQHGQGSTFFFSIPSKGNGDGHA